MPKVMYACTYCDKLNFTDIEDVKKHEYSCRAKIFREKKKKLKEKQQDELLQKEINSVKSVSEIEELINRTVYEKYKVNFNLCIKKVVYSEKLSNTHSCPKNKECNWNCDPNLPSSYPGFTCRVTYDVVKTNYNFDVKYFIEQKFNFCFRTGGPYGQDANIWLDDWIGIKNQVEKEKALVEKWNKENDAYNKKVINEIVNNPKVKNLRNNYVNHKENIEILTELLDKLRRDYAVILEDICLKQNKQPEFPILKLIEAPRYVHEKNRLLIPTLDNPSLA